MQAINSEELETAEQSRLACNSQSDLHHWRISHLLEPHGDCVLRILSYCEDIIIMSLKWSLQLSSWGIEPG